MNTFLEPDSEVQGDDSAPYAVLPVPYERTVSYGRGTAGGPAAILRASHEVELFDEEFRAPLGLRVQTLPEVACAAGSEAGVQAEIRARAEPVLRAGRFLLALGGEHTVSVPLVEAARAACGPLTVLQLDAHTDLRAEFRGNPLSHACVMWRVRQMGVPTVHVGTRSLSAEEDRLIRAESIPVFWARDIRRARGSAWIERVVSALGERVYVTVDVDALDPALMPGTGTPEPGGLDWDAATGLLRRVCETREVVAADVVELAPMPGTQVSEFVAARLAAKLLTYHARGRGGHSAFDRPAGAR